MWLCVRSPAAVSILKGEAHNLQVAAFAKTPLGTEAILRDRLPSGRSQPESEQLLDQTAQAQAISLRCAAASNLMLLTTCIALQRHGRFPCRQDTQ